MKEVEILKLSEETTQLFAIGTKPYRAKKVIINESLAGNSLALLFEKEHITDVVILNSNVIENKMQSYINCTEFIETFPNCTFVEYRHFDIWCSQWKYFKPRIANLKHIRLTGKLIDP